VSDDCGLEYRHGFTNILTCRKPLRDDAYHGIFEAVFRLVRSEKPEYLRTNLPKKKSTIATRLGNSASVLRLAVEIGVPVISHKTAVAVIDHIRDTLPVADEGYCLPLRNDYLKSLRAILEYPSHVEHLRRKHWQSLNDFLVAGIQNGSAEDTSSKNGASGQTESQDSRNGRYLSVRTSQHSSARSLGSQPTNSTAELLISLRLLTSATNAPLMTRAASILPCLTEFLEYATISQHDAFEGANNILSTAITEDISLARSTVFGLLPVIRRLWSTKSSALKDQMVITLTLGHGLLAAQDGTRLTESEHLSLINLLDVLVLEYQRRTDREMLTIDDLRFTGPDVSQPVGLQGIVPLIESGRALSNWSVVSIIACLSMAVDSFQSREDTAELSSGTSRKRRKVTSRVDEIVSQALAGTGSEKSAALQIIIFLMKESEGAPDTVAGNMLKLAGGILEDDSAVASWSMLLFAQ
jgi:ataxia telangiectasia mutated family protein